LILSWPQTHTQLPEEIQRTILEMLCITNYFPNIPKELRTLVVRNTLAYTFAGISKKNEEIQEQLTSNK